MGLIQFTMMLATQATITTLKNISSLEFIEPISVPYGTDFQDIPLPSQVTALFGDDSSSLVDLQWLEGSYDEDTPGTYSLVANVVPDPDVFTNNSNVQATIDVEVLVQEHSLQFNEANSQLVGFGTAADIQFLHTDPFAISFWFKWPANPASTADVIIGTFNTSSQNRGWEVQISTGGLVKIELRNTPSTNKFDMTTTGDFADDQWHHFFFNKPSSVGSSNMWIDGVDVPVTTGTNNLSATLVTTDPLTLGGRQTGSNYSTGLVDKIAIWDTDQEDNVQDIYNSFKPLDLDEPPIHYWEFDGGSYADTGTSSNKLNGTPVNNPVFSTDVPVNAGDESFQYRIEDGDKDEISEESGYFVWGGNVVEHEGMYYMVGNKWIGTDGFSGWVHDNRIYVGSSANKTGPFALSTEISILRSQSWAANMVTNPNIIKIEDTFYLYYVGTNYTIRSYPVVDSQARNRQKIGVASASHPEGPWTPSENNPILSPSVSDWDQNIVNNPSVYLDGSGDINLVYKSDLNGVKNDLRLGKVKLTTWEGPVTDRATSAPNFGLPDVFAEDPCVWFEDGRYWAIFKAMDSAIVPVGHGILAVSDDGGATFRLALGEHAYSLTINWDDATSNNYSKIERPFVLVESGNATALFTAVLRTNNTSFNIGRTLAAKV